MADREKVMKGLECCTADIPTDNNIHKDDFCKNCPYHKPEFWYCFAQVDLMRDALELLKAQGPRPMTAEELENALDTVVWIETKGLQKNSSSQYAILESYSRKYGYFYLLHLRNEHPSVYPYTKINKTWRPWNIRPTEEQRKAVKWE